MTIGNWITTSFGRGSTLAVEYKEKNQWKKLTWSDYFRHITSARLHLKELGMKEKSHVGIVSGTRWEWAALDLAILGSGAVCVPMYPNLSDEDFLYTVNHSEVSILIIENDAILKQVDRIKPQFEKNVQIIKIPDINFNAEVKDTDYEEFFSICAKIKPEDTATIIYTSGTTGKPKGVVLLHEAVVSEVVEVLSYLM